jgi:hypothetical protein
MPCALDSEYELTLMMCAGSRDSSGNYFSLFGNTPRKSFFVFIIDGRIMRLAKSACTFFPRLLLSGIVALSLLRSAAVLRAAIILLA